VEAEKEIQSEIKKTEENRIKAAEAANKEILKELDAAYKDEIKLLKEANAAALREIKSRYDEQIGLAKIAANEEIKIYEARIKTIDDLMRQENRDDRDESLLDRIKRAQEQLKYELDDANKYELAKEISNLQKEYDKNQSRDKLQDEKDALSEQMNALKDSNNERIKALEESRDAEIAALNETLEARLKAVEKGYADEKKRVEESTAAFIEELNKQNAAEVELNKKSTEDLKANILERANELDVFYKNKQKKAEENVRNERNIFERGTNDIIRDLYAKIQDFAEAGRRAGAAYAAAFAAASASAGASLGGGSSATTNNYSSYALSQSFNVPVASPSVVARETETLLANLTRVY
jgi:hypothetical protein